MKLSVEFPISFRFTLIGLLAQFVQVVHAQESDVYQFVTETNRIQDVQLVADDEFFYATRYDGYTNGNGALFKIRHDGSGFKIIHEFGERLFGANPVGTLVLDGPTLYGITQWGGESDVGTIFKIDTTGTGYQKLLDFDISNGALPVSSLTLSGTTLFCTSHQGGLHGNGLLFKLETDGSGFEHLKDFDGTNGLAPALSSVAVNDTAIYGGTIAGGTDNRGVIYRIDMDGSDYEILASLDNSTGTPPFCGMMLNGDYLYGTTSQSGSNSGGTLFRINLLTKEFEVLHHFGTVSGSNPVGKLLIIDGTVYGMTVNGGGSWGRGIVYSVNLDGSNFRSLHDFSIIDGDNPNGALTAVGDYLYGYVPGGVKKYGVIFKMKTDGSEFSTIYEMSPTNKGYDPKGSLIFPTIYGYGLTRYGGGFNQGVIYRADPEGSGFDVIHSFDGTNGAIPVSSLTFTSDRFYGVTRFGGSSLSGVLFAVDTTGSNFETLVNFTGPNGSFPAGSLADGGDVLYGMASGGGGGSKGTIFKFTKATKQLSTILEFESVGLMRPTGSIVLRDGTLYGLCNGGVGDGVLFSVNTDGSAFTKLVDTTSVAGGRYGNSLTVVGDSIYVTMTQGGANGSGALYRVNIDGTGFVKLHDFTYATGGIPVGEIAVHDGVIYGMTTLGGPEETGVAYAINIDGSGYRSLLDFIIPEGSTSGRVKSVSSSSSAEGSVSIAHNKVYYAVTSFIDGATRSRIILYDLDPVTSVEEPGQLKVDLYPNPASEYIRISTERNPHSIYILDGLGRKQRFRQIDEETFDVSELAPGLYHVVIDSKSIRFIKN